MEPPGIGRAVEVAEAGHQRTLGAAVRREQAQLMRPQAEDRLPLPVLPAGGD